jgi:glycogen debranching enzyme
VYPGDEAIARGLLDSFLPLLDEACIGSISEIFDAEAPYTPRGCVAQAWSVAEVLRVCVKLTERLQRQESGQAEPMLLGADEHVGR